MKKYFWWILSVGLLTALSVFLYSWFKPHRNVGTESAQLELTSDELTQRFLNDPEAANNYFLSADGNSSILIVRGPIRKLLVNSKGESVVYLKSDTAKTGVNMVFTGSDSSIMKTLRLGQTIRIKGAIVAGSRYDADLDFYEPATLVECSLE